MIENCPNIHNQKTIKTELENNDEQISLHITGRYMQLASAPREYSGQNEKPSMAVQAAPAPAGDPLLVSRFLPTRQKSNSRLTLHRTTSAKTRATATLRQLHIPPNVSMHIKLIV